MFLTECSRCPGLWAAGAITCNLWPYQSQYLRSSFNFFCSQMHCFPMADWNTPTSFPWEEQMGCSGREDEAGLSLSSTDSNLLVDWNSSKNLAFNCTAVLILGDTVRYFHVFMWNLALHRWSMQWTLVHNQKAARYNPSLFMKSV